MIRLRPPRLPRLKRERMVLLTERLALVLGFLSMSAALVAVDWRLGLFFAGAGLSGSALDLPRRRA